MLLINLRWTPYVQYFFHARKGELLCNISHWLARMDNHICVNVIIPSSKTVINIAQKLSPFLR